MSATIIVHPTEAQRVLAKCLKGILLWGSHGRRNASYLISFDKNAQDEGFLLSFKRDPSAPTAYVRRRFGTLESAQAAVTRIELGETPETGPRP